MRCRRDVREGVSSIDSKTKLRKGLWSPEEDNKLINYITKNGLDDSWTYISKHAGLQRCGKSCRLRWVNYLRPDLKCGPFSCQEERLIIHLQSILGNRWSLIAAHIPGRTDNEIKNYWNSSIKKKLMPKHHRSCFPSINGNTNSQSKIASQSDYIPNTTSLFVHDAFKPSQSTQPYLFMPEAYQSPNNTFNAAAAHTGENQLTIPRVLELKHGQVQDQNDEISISIDSDPSNNQLISFFHPWLDATSTHTHESVSSHVAPGLQTKTPESSTGDRLIIESCRPTVPYHAAAGSGDYSIASTSNAVSAGFVDGSRSLIEEFEDDGNLFVNETEIVIDYSSFKAVSSGSSASHSYSNPADYRRVVYPVADNTREAEVSLVEDYEKTTHQSCHPLNSSSQFCVPGAFQAEDDFSDRLNLSYDFSLGVPNHIDIEHMSL